MERLSIPAQVEGLLTAQQRAVMARVLEEESRRREHLVVHLSGSHAYGFPSPDSDLDLKAIHITSTVDLLGFEVPASTVDRMEIIDGVEIDYTSNELAPALLGVLGGNGNFIERVLGGAAPYASGLLDELGPLARRALSRRVHRHYSGFARNQLCSLEKEPTVKKLLYVLRTALTGVHLLETGEVEPDLSRLMVPYQLVEAAELIERKRAGERAPLDPVLLERWTSRVEGLLHRLDEARAASPLPAEPPNKGELCEWLLAVRRSRLG
jgi:predicted nucleotidyltransferase